MTSRMNELTDRIRSHREAAKLDDLNRDNDRLRLELRTLRSELDRDRDEREELLDALKSTRVTKVVKKRRGLVRTLIIGGAAYILGARAGRERYEVILEGLRSLRDRGKERLTHEADEDVLVVETPAPEPSTPPERPSERMGAGLSRGTSPTMAPTPSDRERHTQA